MQAYVNEDGRACVSIIIPGEVLIITDTGEMKLAVSSKSAREIAHALLEHADDADNDAAKIQLQKDTL
jgi:hypothetical protein